MTSKLCANSPSSRPTAVTSNVPRPAIATRSLADRRPRSGAVTTCVDRSSIWPPVTRDAPVERVDTARDRPGRPPPVVGAAAGVARRRPRRSRRRRRSASHCKPRKRASVRGR
jgi:hypothetical protein